jgi:hypothetical protein
MLDKINELSLVLFLILILLSCEIDEAPIKWDADFELTYSHTLRIELDSVTNGLPGGYNGIFSTNNPDDSIFTFGKTYFQFISQRGEWLVYDLETGKLIHRIPMRMPDDKYEFGMLGAYLPINSDSIYMLDYPFLTLVNHKGEIVDRHMVKEDSKLAQYIPTPHWRPVISGSNILTGFTTENLPPRRQLKKITMQELIGSTMYIDISNGKRSFHHHYPKKFIEDTYLSKHHYFAVLENYVDGQDLLGFASSDSLYVLKDKEIIKQFPAQLSTFKPFSQKKPREDDYDYFRTNYSYGAHFYDHANALIYRLVGLPIPEWELKNPNHSKANNKQLAVLVLDKNFNKIAESVLSNKFNDNIAFLYNGQLYLWDFEQSLIDEDHIYFGVFSLTPKQQL